MWLLIEYRAREEKKVSIRAPTKKSQTHVLIHKCLELAYENGKASHDKYLSLS